MAEEKQRLTLGEAIAIAKNCSMPTAPALVSLQDEVVDALDTLHNLGQLLWWKDTVILDPEWLVNAFTTFIRDPALHPMPWLDAELARLVTAGVDLERSRSDPTTTPREEVTSSSTDDMILERANAVQLLRNRCVLTSALFDTVWPLATSGAVSGPRYTENEQEVRVATIAHARDALQVRISACSSCHNLSRAHELVSTFVRP
jgi:hypothetical protein